MKNTTIDDEGNYPLPDEFYFENVVPPFSKLWKEEFQFFPQVPNDWKLRPPFEEFARRIYEESLVARLDEELTKQMQKAINEAYRDGYKDGIDDGTERCRDAMSQVKNI